MWFGVAPACCCVLRCLCGACLLLCFDLVAFAADPFEYFESMVCVVSCVVEFSTRAGAALPVGYVFADADGSGFCLTA